MRNPVQGKPDHQCEQAMPVTTSEVRESDLLVEFCIYPRSTDCGADLRWTAELSWSKLLEQRWLEWRQASKP